MRLDSNGVHLDAEDRRVAWRSAYDNASDYERGLHDGLMSAFEILENRRYLGKIQLPDETLKFLVGLAEEKLGL